MPADNDTRAKILFLAESLSRGGAEKTLSILLRHLDRKRFDVSLCCVSDVGVYLDEVRPFVHYTSILPDPSSLIGLRLFFYKVRYALVHSRILLPLVGRLALPRGNDVEVAFTEGFATLLLSKAPSSGARRIAWVHTDLLANPWTQAKGIFRDLRDERRAYLRFSDVIAVSDSVSLSLLSGYGLKARTIYNPLDGDEIVRLSRAGMDLPRSQSLRMISVGRLVPQKAFDMLLDAAALLRREGMEFELLILGDGPCRDSLREKVADEGLGDCVRLMGAVSNPFPYMAASDLYVCSSVAEGYSTAVCEALILGIPVVTTDCAGMKEIFGGHGCGVITACDAVSLSRGVKEVASSPSTLEMYGKAAAGRGRDFALPALMKPVEDLLSA